MANATIDNSAALPPSLPHCKLRRVLKILQKGLCLMLVLKTDNQAFCPMQFAPAPYACIPAFFALLAIVKFP